MTIESDSENVTQPLMGKGDAPGGRALPMLETHYRSVVKAVSWRVTGTLDTMVVSFLVTGRLKLALSIGFVELFTKIGLYYLHERLWDKIRFGRVKAKEDYEI